jgi:hypothetical protein
MVELQSAEYIICGFFTKFFTIIKTVLGSYGVQVFKNIKNPRLKLHDNLKSS